MKLPFVIESLDFAEESGNLFSLSFDRTERSIPLKLILVRQIDERALCGTAHMRAMADLGTSVLKGQLHRYPFRFKKEIRPLPQFDIDHNTNLPKIGLNWQEDGRQGDRSLDHFR